MRDVFGKKKISAILAASLITANFVCAADSYKNNVVDVRVNGEAGNAVKVTIYTDRPYTDPVVVNKKANNKYVILLPETGNTLKGAPVVTNAAGSVSNVSVNTQNVSGGKGYTKIVITSEKMINVVPRTQQLTAKSVQKSAQTTVLKPDSCVNTKTLATNTTAPKKVAQSQPNKTAKPAVVKKDKDIVKKNTQPVNAVKQTTVAKKPVVKTVEPIKVLEEEVKTGQYANVERYNNDEDLNNRISDKLADNDSEKSLSNESKNEKSNVISNIISVLKDYQQIDIWKLLLLAGAVTFPVIVIMIILSMDKKINKKIDLTFRKEEDVPAEYIDESPISDIEKTEASQENYNQDLQIIENDDIFKVSDEDNNEEFDVNTTADNSMSEEYIASADNEDFNNDFEDADFENDIESHDYVLNSDEVLNSEEIENQPYEVVQKEEEEQYNPDGFLADFSEVNDKDFIDELTIQTMASNNADGLPEESPVDKIFDFIQEDDSNATDEDVVDTVDSSYKDGLTMLTEVRINDNTGLYLVNYENFSSLVGHIDDEYFVIKKFDDVVSGKVILKLAEKLKDSTRYLVRVGKNKMVMEITDNSMTKLLDL